MQNSLPNVVVNTDGADPAMDGLWHQIHQAFLAKSATANPDKLPTEAYWGGYNWVNVNDGEHVKFICHSKPDGFMQNYGATSFPTERDKPQVIKEEELQLETFLTPQDIVEEAEAPAPEAPKPRRRSRNKAE
jgi:hypothetical protein